LPAIILSPWPILAPLISPIGLAPCVKMRSRFLSYDVVEDRPALWLQLGFFNIVGLPLFKAMAELFEEAQPMLEGVMANLRLWEQAADTPL